jgi:hypothetical protein
MSDEPKQEAKKEPKAPKAPKAPKEPKEPRFSAQWTSETWAKHLESMSVPAAPEGWLAMSEIVTAAVKAGIKRSRICSAMGGDRGKDAAWAPVFSVVYVGGRKYGSPDILTEGFELLLNDNYHKVPRKAKEKKEPVAGEAAPAKKVKVKVAPAAKDPEPWVAKE